MSIKSLEEAFETLRALPEAKQLLACEFIDLLEQRAEARVSPASMRASKRARRNSAPRKSKSAVVLKDGVWVHTGAIMGKFDKSFYRGAQVARPLRHPQREQKAHP